MRRHRSGAGAAWLHPHHLADHGRTGVRLLDAGNIVRTTDSTGIVVVTQLKPISVLFTLPEVDLPEIQRAMRPARCR